MSEIADMIATIRENIDRNKQWTDNNVKRRKTQVIPGTPLVHSTDRQGMILAIYHRTIEGDSSYPHCCYVPSIHKCINIPTGSLKLLNGTRFDPGSMIDTSWETMVPNDMLLHQHTISVVKNWLNRARLASLLDLQTSHWHDMLIGERKPVRCLLPVDADTSGALRNGLYIVGGEDKIEVTRALAEYQYAVEYDPGVTKQKWQVDTMAGIQAAISEYDNHVRVAKEISLAARETETS